MSRKEEAKIKKINLLVTGLSLLLGMLLVYIPVRDSSYASLLGAAAIIIGLGGFIVNIVSTFHRQQVSATMSLIGCATVCGCVALLGYFTLWWFE